MVRRSEGRCDKGETLMGLALFVLIMGGFGANFYVADEALERGTLASTLFGV
jgi:hypothetical protein